MARKQKQIEDDIRNVMKQIKAQVGGLPDAPKAELNRLFGELAKFYGELFEAIGGGIPRWIPLGWPQGPKQ